MVLRVEVAFGIACAVTTNWEDVRIKEGVQAMSPWSAEGTYGGKHLSCGAGKQMVILETPVYSMRFGQRRPVLDGGAVPRSFYASG